MDGEEEDDQEIHGNSKLRKKCKRLVWKERMHNCTRSNKMERRCPLSRR